MPKKDQQPITKKDLDKQRENIVRAVGQLTNNLTEYIDGLETKLEKKTV